MERRLIEKIRNITQARSTFGGSGPKWIKKAIGDDCAELAVTPSANVLLTTDTMVEGIHFSFTYFTPFQLGKKLASVNLSDIAAMGGVPKAALLNLEVPDTLRDPGPNFWNEFAKGLGERLSEFSTVLVGGDTVREPGKRLGLTLTIMGEIEKGGAVYRNGAKRGELIYCSGYLGEGSCGYEILMRKGIKLPLPLKRHLIRRHLDPVPRVHLGRLLSRLGASSMIDVSDGIATDLAHVATQSGLCALISKSRLPISRALRIGAKAMGKDPVAFALFGGEDFELVWTISPNMKREMEKEVSRLLGHPPIFLGVMKEGQGVLLEGNSTTQDITYRGYEH